MRIISLPGRLAHLLLVLVALAWTFFPLYWITVTSFKENWEVLTWPPSPVPLSPTLQHYVRLIESDRFYVYVFNSLVVSVGATALSLLLGSLASYGLVRVGLPRPFGNVFLVWVLTIRMIPPITIVIPLFTMLRSVGLLDTRLGLIIAYQVYTLPYVTWLLFSFLSSVPRDLDEAALVDGANRLQALIHVLLPAMAPGLIAISVLSMIMAWNEFLYALILVNSPDKYTVTVIVANYIQEFTIDWGRLSASGLVSMLPVLALTFYVQKYVIRGIAFGGVRA
jgi:multiple sugar transport system permease protein